MPAWGICKCHRQQLLEKHSLEKAGNQWCGDVPPTGHVQACYWNKTSDGCCSHRHPRSKTSDLSLDFRTFFFSTIRSSFTDESLFLTGYLFPTASWTKQTTNYPGDSRYRPGEEVHQRAPFRNFDGPHCIGGWVWLRCIPSIGYIGGEVFCLWLWWYAAKTQFTFYVLNWSESRPFSNNECNIENYILKMFTTHNNQCLRLGFKHMLCMPRLGWGCVISRHPCDRNL